MGRGSTFEDLIVVAALVCFVAKKVDLFIALLLYELEAVRLVPSDREHVEGNLQG